MMLALALLASHLVGDFVLSNRWFSERKLEDKGVRVAHVLVYGVAFWPVVVWQMAAADVGFGRAVAFLGALYILHYLTDSRRFTSTLGDVLGWWTMTDRARREAWEDYNGSFGTSNALRQPVPKEWLRWPPPNPWTPIPLLTDQTLHIVQLVALGWLLA